MSKEKKAPKIEFYCKICKKLGRQKDFIMPVMGFKETNNVKVACVNCLQDNGYKFKNFPKINHSS